MNCIKVLSILVSNQGHLLVKPAGTEDDRKNLYPFIYRMATGAFWNVDEEAFSSPIPREWSYSDWIENIVHCASSELGVELFLSEDTVWVDVLEPDRTQMEKVFMRSDA